MSTEAPLSGISIDSVPTAHLLRAAIRAGSVLDRDGAPVTAVRSSYLQLPTGGLYRYEDLMAGEALLIEAGLVQLEDECLYPSPCLSQILTLGEQDASELLLSVRLAACSPLWLQLAVQENMLAPEVIPSAQAEVLAGIIHDQDRREALLLALGRRHNPETNIKLGEIGEELVVAESKAQLCAAKREDLAARVQRVSLISDQLGYDVIATDLSGRSRRMEVKTTGGLSNIVRVFLTRNEAEVGLRDPSWAMVVCQANNEEDARIVGWCSANDLRPLLPIDSNPSTRWMSVALTLHQDTLSPGLPLFE